MLKTFKACDFCDGLCCRFFDDIPLTKEDLLKGIKGVHHPNQKHLARKGSQKGSPCQHEEDGRCTVWNKHRPHVCEMYTCAGDSRIWSGLNNQVKEYILTHHPHICPKCGAYIDKHGSDVFAALSVVVPMTWAGKPSFCKCSP